MEYKLRQLRKEKDISVKCLASAVGVCPLTIYRYETGKREPTLLIAKRLAAALGVTVDELIRKGE